MARFVFRLSPATSGCSPGAQPSGKGLRASDEQSIIRERGMHCAGFDFSCGWKLRCPAMSPSGRNFKLPHPEPVDALTYARFTGISTFMRLPHITQPEELEVALIGVPFDGGTTYRPGPRFGPRHVRAQSAIIRPWNPVLHVNPFAKHRTADFGDLAVNPLSIEDTFRRIERAWLRLWRRACAAFALEETTPSACRSCAQWRESTGPFR